MGMMINRRRAYGGKSLPYDAEIEYLESSGAQYILTNAIPKGKLIFMEYIAEHGQGDRYNPAIGSWKTSSITEFSFDHYNSGRLYTKDYSEKMKVFDNLGVGSKVNLKIQNKSIFVDNVVKYTNQEMTLTYTNLFGIFGISIENRIAYFKGGKVYKLCITTDQGSVDLIPVRIGQVGYLYDKVSGQLFGNNETGDFILGPDV